MEEGRGFVRKKVRDIGWTLLLLVLTLVIFVLIFVGGSVAEDLLGTIGLGDVVADVWLIARWPAALVFTMFVYAIVYYAAPNVEVPRFQLITPGAVLGVVAWIVASAGFFFYVSNFSSYSATYGAFAAAVILLVWLWLTNVVVAARGRAQRDDRPRGARPSCRSATTDRRCRPRSGRRLTADGGRPGPGTRTMRPAG